MRGTFSRIAACARGKVTGAIAFNSENVKIAASRLRSIDASAHSKALTDRLLLRRVAADRDVSDAKALCTKRVSRTALLIGLDHSFFLRKRVHARHGSAVEIVRGAP